VDSFYTTYVGSFPLDYSVESIKRIVCDVVDIGIDYPALPQLRSFIDMFMEPLVKANAVKPTLRGFTVSNLDNILGLKPSVPEYLYALNLLEGYRGRVKGVRVAVTGPFTLASQIYIDYEKIGLSGSILTVKNYTWRIVEYVYSIVKWVEGLGVNIICIDEPILSVIVGRKLILFNYTVDEIIDMLNRVLNIGCLGAVHVCGVVSPQLAEILLNTRAKILDHEYHDTPRNFDIYGRGDVEKYDKLLSIGVVSSRSGRVESVDEVKSLISKSLNLYGSHVFMFKPDCGFAALKGLFKRSEDAYNVSIGKLKAIVEGVKLFRMFPT
jgi:5-methyltetrahydropteroyltriglutamate--homocysteine methyltransferase